MNLVADTIIELFDVESLLDEMKSLDHEMKVLKARYDKIKQQLIKTYFSQSPEFVGSNGLVMATYKSHQELRFDSKKFKDDHPILYKKYQKESIVNKFLIKK